MMFKKITAFAVMAVLCLCFSAFGQNNGAVDITAKGIQVGQVVPDVVINNLHNYKDKNGVVSGAAKLSDFRGKLLILDFWATWCSPCVAMIPKMDSLQKVFGDKVAFLSVTYQKEIEVLPFLEKLEKRRGVKYGLPVVTDDKVLKEMFPHVYLPHYAWVDAKGVLRSLTSYGEVNADNISSMLKGDLVAAQKRDMKISFDVKRPFLVNGNGGSGDNMIYHSVLTGFSEGVGAQLSYTRLDTTVSRKAFTMNVSMLDMMKFAHGGDRLFLGWNRVLLEGLDPKILRSGLKGQEYASWLRNGNGYCYELVVPPVLSPRIFELMREDIKRFFPAYSAGVETRKVKCLVLRRTSDQILFISNGGPMENSFTPSGFRMHNSTFQQLAVRLEVNALQRSSYPVVDGTGYRGRVDMEINANLSDVGAMNLALAKYDLKFVVEDFPTEVLVVRNNPDRKTR